MEPTPLRIGYAVLVVACALSLAAGSTHAALLAYDGYADGGGSPNTAAGEYETGGGYSTDALIGQSPTTTGFSVNPWTNDGSTYTADIYYRNDSGQLTYYNAGKQLQTTDGQVQLSRDNAGASGQLNAFRDLNIGNSLPNNLYISFLIEVSDGAEFALRSASTNTSEVRRFNAGINAAGNPYTTGSGTGSGTATNNALDLSGNGVHFLVIKLVNDQVAFTDDEVNLYVDPNLTSEAANSLAVSNVGGNHYVAGNLSWSLDDIYLRSILNVTGEYVIIDEVRVGTTWADVTPYLIVPAPAALPMGLLGLLALGARRRRR